MSQMKHFVVYNGQNQNANTDIQDQGAARALPDAVRGRLRRRPRRGDDVLVPDLARHLDASCRRTVSSLARPRRSARSRAGREPADLAAQRVALLVRAAAEPQLRPARPVGLAGVRRLRLPGDALHLGDPAGRGPGDADAERLLRRRQRDADRPASRRDSDRQHVRRRDRPRGIRARTRGAMHVGGIPNNFQGSGGCRLPDDRRLHAGRRRRRAASCRSRSFNQSLARILYQEQRFGMLGCDDRAVPRRARTPAASAATAPARRRCRSAATASSARRTATPRSSRSTPRRARRCSRTTATRCRSRASRPRRRHPRHRREREPHGRRPDQRGLDRLHRPRRDQPAAAAQGVQRQPERVHVRARQRPDRRSRFRASVLEQRVADRRASAACNLSVDGGAPTKDTSRSTTRAVRRQPARAGPHLHLVGYLYVPTGHVHVRDPAEPTLPTTLNCPQTGQFGSRADGRHRRVTLLQRRSRPRTSRSHDEHASPTPVASRSTARSGPERAPRTSTARPCRARRRTPATPTGPDQPHLRDRHGAARAGTTNCTAPVDLTAEFHPIRSRSTTRRTASRRRRRRGGRTRPWPPVPRLRPRASASRTRARAATSPTPRPPPPARARRSCSSTTARREPRRIAADPAVRRPRRSRPSRALSAASVDLINAVAAANPNTIVVINNDNPVDTLVDRQRRRRCSRCGSPARRAARRPPASCSGSRTRAATRR